jgi:uncharacterized membrane protein YjjP (DUF1212 family)
MGSGTDWFLAGFSTCAMIGWFMDGKWHLFLITFLLSFLVIAFQFVRQAQREDRR